MEYEMFTWNFCVFLVVVFFAFLFGLRRKYELGAQAMIVSGFAALVGLYLAFEPLPHYVINCQECIDHFLMHRKFHLNLSVTFASIFLGSAFRTIYNIRARKKEILKENAA